ncbi:type IV secretion protein IcmL [Legionella israelensis]|uniref:DotI/IcmL family type IV secretion protein n=1 Tax=Legionella israelensis TaxID=454 RepID=UPI00117D3558|nr:DotI/IcmL family type IV secretion protein [Legionella israelensis]QDP71341.1 type IV secretion protein IcmL [Legionella israelensis]
MKKTSQSMLFLFLLCISTLIRADADNIRLSVWANEAIIATYTFNYKNYLQRQKEIARYFTADAWKAYSEALLASKLLETVQKNNYYVSAVATLPPEVKKLNGENWQATMPVLVVYENPQYKQKQTLNVTITFKNASSKEGIRGLVITSLQAKTAKDPCVCQSDADQSEANKNNI